MSVLDLFNAILNGDIESTRSLLAQGINVDTEPPPKSSGVWERSPLLEAIVDEQVEIVRLLLEAGADPNKELALLLAVGDGFRNSVPSLLQYGADPNIKDDEGSVPLKEAARNGDLDSAKALLEAGADIEYFGGMDGATVLSAAALAGHLEMVRFLLESGADINAQDVNYKTVLQRLVSSLAWEKNQMPEIKEKIEAIIQFLQAADAGARYKNERLSVESWESHSSMYFSRLLCHKHRSKR